MPKEQDRDDLDEALDGGQWFTVQAITTERLGQTPKDFRLRLIHALSLSKTGLFDEPRMELRRLWRRAVLDDWAWARGLVAGNLGDLYERKARFSHAENWYRRAIEVEPDHADRFIDLGSLYRRWARFDDAERVFREGAKCVNGPPEEAMAKLGVLLASQGRFAEAVEFLDRAIEISPEYRWAIEKHKDITRAMEIVKNPGGAADDGNGRALKKQEHDESDAAWDANHRFTILAISANQLKRSPSDFHARFMRAWSLPKMGLYAEARKELDALRRQTRSSGTDRDRHFVALGLVGHLYLAKGDFARAESWCRRAIEASPNDAGGYVFLSSVYHPWGRLEDAVRTLREGAACTEGAPDEAMANLGILLASQGKFEEALRTLDRAIEIDPKHEIAINYRADITRAFEIRREND